MKHVRAAPFLFLVVGLAATARADKTPACIRSWGETVATGFGYNHVVVIDNTCDKAATCTVSTDVAPDPIQASAPAKQRTELVTFRGSPTRVFKPKVECRLE